MDLIDDIRYAYVADQIGEHQSGITSTAPLGRTIRDVEREATERFDAWLAEERRAAKEEAWDAGYDSGETEVWERFSEDHQDSRKLTNPYRKDKP